MAKRIVMISLANLTGTWISDYLGAAPLTRASSLTVPPSSFAIGTITTGGNQIFTLYNDDGTIYNASASLGNLPPGFSVTSIEQFSGMPCGNSLGGLYASIPLISGGGGSINSWTMSLLGLSMGGITIYDPPTMSFNYTSGLWEFVGTAQANSGNPQSSAPQVPTLSASEITSLFTNPPLLPSSEFPMFYFVGTWDADEGLCPVIGPLTNVQIIDTITGEFSWELPPGVDGVVITLSRAGQDDIIASVITPTLNYTPSDIFGIVSVTINPITTYPICYGPDYYLELAITVPYEPFGPSGITGGIDLGGTPTLQFIGNPSGIYTLVPDQFRDILYERIPAPATNPVKIPRPFGKGPYVGD